MIDSIYRMYNRVVKFIKPESTRVLTTPGGQGPKRLLLTGYRVSVWDVGNVLDTFQDPSR